MFGFIDVDYMCFCVDIGVNGLVLNVKVFNVCELKEVIDSGKLNFLDLVFLFYGWLNFIFFCGWWCISFVDVDNEVIF